MVFLLSPHQVDCLRFHFLPTFFFFALRQPPHCIEIVGVSCPLVGLLLNLVGSQLCNLPPPAQLLLELDPLCPMESPIGGGRGKLRPKFTLQHFHSLTPCLSQLEDKNVEEHLLLLFHLAIHRHLRHFALSQWQVNGLAQLGVALYGLQDQAHNRPEEIRVLWLHFVQISRCFLLLLVFTHPDIRHEEVSEELLIGRILHHRPFVHPADFPGFLKFSECNGHGIQCPLINWVRCQHLIQDCRCLRFPAQPHQCQ